MPSTDSPRSYYGVRPDGTAAGWFTNHRDLTVAEQAFELRQRGLTYVAIADRLGFQHWDHAQSAVRAHARRAGAEARVSFRAPARRRTATVAGQRNRTFAWLSADPNALFGVEVECARGTMPVSRTDQQMAGGYPIAHATAAIVAAGINAAAERYNHSTPTGHWKVTYDCTVTGVEAVSPKLHGDAGMAEVGTVMTALRRAGAREGGGVHVHHNVADFDQTQMMTLVDNIEATQRLLSRYLPGSRQRSSWCPLASRYDFAEYREAIRTGRLTAVGHYNGGGGRYRFASLSERTRTYGTVEFRGHGPTLNGSKLRTWVSVTQAVVQAARIGVTLTCTTTGEMLGQLQAHGLISATVAEAWTARVAGLHGETMAA